MGQSNKTFLRWVATLAHQLLSQVPRAPPPPRRVERKELFLPPFSGNTSKVSDVVIPSPRCSSTTVSLLRRPILTSAAGKQERLKEMVVSSVAVSHKLSFRSMARPTVWPSSVPSSAPSVSAMATTTLETGSRPATLTQSSTPGPIFKANLPVLLLLEHQRLSSLHSRLSSP